MVEFFKTIIYKVFGLLSNVEVIKTIAFAIIYPMVVACVALRIAKFHFEKDRKVEYLRAKDKVATDLIKQICVMLIAMWEMVNIDHRIAKGDKSPELPQRKQQAYTNFYKAITDSYLLLGLMGLYYGPKIVEEISQLQSDLNDMVNSNDFAAFNEWDNFRRKRLLPVLNRVYKELKYTVFDKPFLDK